MAGNIEHVEHQNIRHNFVTGCLDAAVVAEGTNAATIKTTNAISFMIDGVLYAKAATDNIAVTAASVQAVSTKCMYLVSITAAGAVVVTKGTAVGASENAYLPDLPAGNAPVGAFRIVTDGVTTFTAGTTDIGAAGITETFFDLGAVDNSKAF